MALCYNNNFKEEPTMKKILVVLLALVLSMSAFAAFAEETEYDIAVLVWKFDDTYGSSVRKAMDAAAEEIGEELGITNPGYTDISQYQDVESTNYYRILMEEEGKTREEALEIIGARSRDNGRTPMQWDGSENAGFTTGTPWLGIPANHTYINVEDESKDPDSVLAFYKKLVALRKEYEIIAAGQIRFTDAGNENIISYERTLNGQKLSVFCNLRGTEQPLGEVFEAPGGKLLIGNYNENSDAAGQAVRINVLRPFEIAAVLQ
jgi:trehalose-6-phosphate hydrolase